MRRSTTSSPAARRRLAPGAADGAAARRGAAGVVDRRRAAAAAGGASSRRRRPEPAPGREQRAGRRGRRAAASVRRRRSRRGLRPARSAGAAAPRRPLPTGSLANRVESCRLDPQLRPAPCSPASVTSSRVRNERRELEQVDELAQLEVGPLDREDERALDQAEVLDLLLGVGERRAAPGRPCGARSLTSAVIPVSRWLRVEKRSS